MVLRVAVGIVTLGVAVMFGMAWPVMWQEHRQQKAARGKRWKPRP